MEKYKLYLDTAIGDAPPGTYEVVETNKSYDTAPTMATIIFNEKEVQVPVAKYSWGHHGGIVSGQLLYADTDLEKVLGDADKLDDDKVKSHLDGLHHSEYTVEEFIQEFGGGDARVALKLAIRTDWDAMPIPEKRMNEIYFNALKNRE